MSEQQEGDTEQMTEFANKYVEWYRVVMNGRKEVMVRATDEKTAERLVRGEYPRFTSFTVDQQEAGDGADVIDPVSQIDDLDDAFGVLSRAAEWAEDDCSMPQIAADIRQARDFIVSEVEND